MIFLILVPFFWYLFPFNNVDHSFNKGYGFYADNLHEFKVPYDDAASTYVALNASNANVYLKSTGSVSAVDNLDQKGSNLPCRLPVRGDREDGEHDSSGGRQYPQ